MNKLMNKLPMMMFLVGLMTGCGLFNPTMRADSGQAPMMSLTQGRPNFAGQRVDVHDQLKAAGSMSARTCKSFGFSGFEVGYMHKMTPRANRILIEVGETVLDSRNCLGMAYSQVFADLDEDGFFDTVSYSAAPSRTTVWVPSDHPGMSLTVIGLSCDNMNRCRKVWEKRETRGHQPIQKVDQYTGASDRY